MREHEMTKIDEKARLEMLAAIAKEGPELVRKVYGIAAPAQLECATSDSGGWKKRAIEMERQRDYYRQRCQTLHEHKDGEVWYWQGDGGDHLESMSHGMLVVIRADQLRELSAPPAQTPPRLTEQEIAFAYRVFGGGVQGLRAVESAVRKQFGVNDE
jgi:hypothetical protein